MPRRPTPWRETSTSRTAASPNSRPLRTPERLLQGEVERARAWNAVAHGATSQAREILARAADSAQAAGMAGMELGLLHDLARLGGQ